MKKIGLSGCFLFLIFMMGCFHRVAPPTGLEGYDPQKGVIMKEVGQDILLRHVPLYIGGVPVAVNPEEVKDRMYVFHDQNFWGVPVVSAPPIDDKLEMVKESDNSVWWKINKAKLMARIITSKRPPMGSAELTEGKFFTYGSWLRTNGNRYVYWAEYTFSSDSHLFINTDGSASLLLK